MVDPKLGMEWWLTGWFGRGVVHKVRQHYSWYFSPPSLPMPALFMLNYTSSIFTELLTPPPKKYWRTLWTAPNTSTKSFGAFDKVKCVFINPVDCCLLPKSLTRWGIFDFWGPWSSQESFFLIFCMRNQMNCSHYNKYSWIILCVVEKYVPAMSSQVSLFMWYVGIFT